MTEVKQIKLIGGEEVLCDLVGIELDEYDNEVMVIRAAYSLISQEDFENGFRYYTFRPFMMHINDPSHVLLLNAGAVICLTNPSDMVSEQYIKHIEQHRKEEREKDKVDDVIEKLLEEAERDEKVVKFNPKLH
jgi:hypothetical protein